MLSEFPEEKVASSEETELEEQIVNRSIQEEIEKVNMKTDNKSKVDMTLMNPRVEDKCFYLLHTNVFCLTAERGVVPAKLSLAGMSLRKGLEEV